MININILIVDDDKDIRLLLSAYLKKEGYEQIFFAENAKVAYEYLGIGDYDKRKEIDLIILDIVLGNENGIEICSNIKEKEEYQDIPIIMITAKKEKDYLKNAFAAGAHDYIEKPINKIEFLARIKAALRLREEMKKRKAREKELLKTSKKLKKANKKLGKMASMDGLTGLANRRLFDEILEKEMRRAKRKDTTISLIMADIDNFKDYNDNYGHQAGDECLKKIAKAIEDTTNRPSDLAARYGGEEFSVILPETNNEGAIKVAENIRKNIISLEIEHEKSEVAEFVTLSLGVNSSKIIGEVDQKRIEEFIEKADKALYEAKENGRNMVISN
ncbi:MAG: diguanylate cyclase [Bacillota bacterium]